MYIKLTRFDSRPIWLNAAFVVTVEPRRDGRGAIVVPIGDGLDYEVCESPEDVLRLLDGVPTPAVVPVPSSDSLTPTPEDVSPEPEPTPAQATDEVKPKKRVTRAKKAQTPKAPKKPASAEEPPAPRAALELSEAEVQRLKRLAPKSLGKLKNTLMTQFKIADIGANVAALVQMGACALDGNRVLWPTSEPTPEQAETGAEMPCPSRRASR